MFKCLFAFAVSTVSATQGPGFGVSFNEGGLNTAKNIIGPYIFASLKDLQIPEVDFDGGKLTNVEVELPPPPMSDLNVNLDSASNGLELTAKGISAHMTSDFVFKKVITVTGSMDVKINNIQMDFEVGLGTQPGTPTPELAPKLSAQKVAVTINPDDVDITLSGSLVAKIAGVFIPLIKSTILPTIVQQVQTEAKTLIDTTIDQDLALYGVQ